MRPSWGMIADLLKPPKRANSLRRTGPSWGLIVALCFFLFSMSVFAYTLQLYYRSALGAQSQWHAVTASR